ncbi:hypothetical protein Ancab_006198 [Ancistrocladus abbreviatus]
MTDAKIEGFCTQTSVYHPGMDVTKAELASRTNWRRQEKTETVEEWKAKVYEVHNVVFSFRSRKVANSDNDAAGSEQILPLELDEDSEEGFLVAENPSFGSNFSDRQWHSSFISEDISRRNNSFVRSEREWVTMSRKSVDINLTSERRRMSSATTGISAVAATPPSAMKEDLVNGTVSIKDRGAVAVT